MEQTKPSHLLIKRIYLISSALEAHSKFFVMFWLLIFFSMRRWSGRVRPTYGDQNNWNFLFFYFLKFSGCLLNISHCHHSSVLPGFCRQGCVSVMSSKHQWHWPYMLPSSKNINLWIKKWPTSLCWRWFRSTNERSCSGWWSDQNQTLHSMINSFRHKTKTKHCLQW